jgi:hypothetical protein
VVPCGAGWSTTGNVVYQLWCDSLWLSGYEVYTQQRYVVDRAYLANNYW